MKERKVNLPLDIPFKEFMPGQIIKSQEFNDDMRDIEDKVNEIIVGHNALDDVVGTHTSDKNNPHEVNPHQIGAYESEEVDSMIEDVKNGNLNDNAITNRVLDDGCVDNRNLLDGAITVSKVDPHFGSQINIEENISITDRYTKTETDQIIHNMVGNGTYSKEELDEKFQEVQAGVIVDGTISADKTTPDFGANIDISQNVSVVDKVTNTQMNTALGSYVTNTKHSQDVTNINNIISTNDSQSITRDNDINKRIDDMQNNLGGSHNHDNIYSKLTHNHDSNYVKKLTGEYSTMRVRYINGHYGLCTTEEGVDTGYIRTPVSGIIPYQSGGYGNIGTSSWKFNQGHFVSVYANDVHIGNSYQSGNTFVGNGTNNQYSGINFKNQNSKKRIEYDAVSDSLYVAGTKTQQSGLSSMKASTFDSSSYAMISGNRLYIQSSDPGNVPVGSVWIKV